MRVTCCLSFDFIKRLSVSSFGILTWSSLLSIVTFANLVLMKFLAWPLFSVYDIAITATLSLTEINEQLVEVTFLHVSLKTRVFPSGYSGLDKHIKGFLIQS